ncbi:MAG TPA: ABC transporter substrate-binding protein [Geminicoccaceae bacterium]|nr:ABC transporter substrate-binding protein [Geminicoccaceae bacterium]
MRTDAVVLAVALVLAPLAAKAADLVVWWENDFHQQENEAVAEIIAAFEQESGRQVELVQPTVDEIIEKAKGAIEAGQPPDFLFALISTYYGQWAYEGRLVDLSNEILPFASLFDRDALASATLLNATTGRRALYALPMGINTNHVHVWRTLLEQAGFTLDDIPKQWDAFWSFWCDRVQPAVRRATGRDDLWGVGLPMSAKANDTFIQFDQFIQAYQANYVSREGELVIDDPEIRRRLIEAINSYAGIYLKGCTPPDSIDWTTIGNNNNKQFLTRRVVMLPNDTLSVPLAIKRERPEDYDKNTATVSWPDGADGQPLAIRTYFLSAVAFNARGHVPLLREWVRFLVGEGWLAHYLDFSGERMLPSMPTLLEQPFWLDPSERHHMVSAIQFLTHPRAYNYAVASGDPRHTQVDGERVWAKAVHRVAADGLSPEEAVDEAIVRIKQILSE